MKLRQLSLKLHRYVGIMVGLLLVAIALTGSILVFHEEIDRYLNPQVMQVVPQIESEKQTLSDRKSPDFVFNKVRSAYPELTLRIIHLPMEADGVYKVGLESKTEEWFDVYINPYSGVILGTKQWGRTLITFIYDIHLTLLAGDFGEKVVGVCGFLLVLLAVTGLILWPGWKKLGTGFKIRWQAPTHLLNYDIHKVAGIWSVVFLVMIAFTGAGLIFYTEFEGAVYWLTRTPPPPTLTSTLQADKAPLALDEILQKADVALPGAKTTFVNIPNKPDGVVRVTKKFPQEVKPSGRSRVFVDQYSGKVLRVENALEAPLPNRFLDSLFPLHTGIYGGLATRIIHVFIGLTPTGLFITGFVMWRQQQWAKARRKEDIRHSQKVLACRDENGYWMNEWPWF